MATQVIMPRLGESIVEGTVGRWLVAEGQAVNKLEPLLTVTTDKIDTEIPSPASGILLDIHVREGQTVAAGALLAVIGQRNEVPGGTSPEAAHSQGAPRSSFPTIRQPASTPLAQRMAAEHHLDLHVVKGSGPGGRITKEDVETHLALDASEGTVPVEAPARAEDFVSPAVARLVAEFGVDLGQVIGTGEGGRVTKKDVMAYIATPVPRGALTPDRHEHLPLTVSEPADALPAGTPPAEINQDIGETAGDFDLMPLTTMRRSIAQHMVLSQQTAAHVTTVMEADMTQVVRAREQLRHEFERRGVRLTFTPFVVQAIIAGLKAVPEANSSFGEDGLKIHRHIHIGVAVAVADGLVVPVIHDADEKSLLGLTRIVNDLADRGRAAQLSPYDVQGGTFTLTNHGTTGSLFATPIIHQPQAAILGVGAIQKRAVVISRGSSILPDAEDAIAIHPMAYLSLTFDHRILDGAGADRFLASVVQFLEDYRIQANDTGARP